MNASKLIAVTDASPDLAGQIVFWELSGETDRQALVDALRNVGLHEGYAPPEVSPRMALTRAVKQYCERRRIAVPTDTDRGWQLVSTHDNGTSIDTVSTLRVKLDGISPVFTPPDHPFARGIESEYERGQTVLAAVDLGGWLTQLAVRVYSAVPLRGRGGMYFIPQDKAQEWNAVRRAVASVSGARIYSVPAMRSDDAVDAVLDALAREAAQECAEIDTAIQTAGARGCRSQANRAFYMAAKVERYETLLERAMPQLKANLEKARALAMDAAFKAEATNVK